MDSDVNAPAGAASATLSSLTSGQPQQMTASLLALMVLLHHTHYQKYDARNVFLQRLQQANAAEMELLEQGVCHALSLYLHIRQIHGTQVLHPAMANGVLGQVLAARNSHSLLCKLFVFKRMAHSLFQIEFQII